MFVLLGPDSTEPVPDDITRSRWTRSLAAVESASATGQEVGNMPDTAEDDNMSILDKNPNVTRD